MKDKDLKKTYISQSNSFVNGIYGMNITQLRVFLITLAKYKQGINVFDNEFEIHLSDLNVDKGNASRQLKAVVDTLAEIKFRKNTEEEYTVYGIFRKPSYKKKQGFIKVRLDDDIKDFVNVWTENFTIAEVNTLLHIPTFYSYRIYMMLKQYQTFKNYRIVNLDELRKILDLQDNSAYKLYGSIKQRILSVAQEHLKDTDMAFEITEEKVGKAVVAVVFHFNKISILEQKKLMLDEHDSDKLELLPHVPILPKSTSHIKVELEKKIEIVLQDSPILISKHKRSYERLTSEFGLTEKQAKTILEKVPLQEVLKVLFDLNVDILNGMHSRAGKPVGMYTMSVIKSRFDFKYKLWQKVETA